MIFYSAGTGGFYDPAENAFIPDDVLEISDEDHQVLLDGPANGMRIVADEAGRPVLVNPLPLSPEVVVENERFWRAQQLTATDGVVTRHRDEQEEGATTTLTAEQYAELQAYRRQLRNWPEAGEFPLIEHRPPVPLWLAGQLQ